MKIRVCKRASIRNGRIEQGLGYGCRAAVEQGKALFRENLAVQPFTVYDGVKQLGRKFFLFRGRLSQGMDGFGKGRFFGQCELLILSQDAGDFL